MLLRHPPAAGHRPVSGGAEPGLRLAPQGTGSGVPNGVRRRGYLLCAAHRLDPVGVQPESADDGAWPGDALVQTGAAESPDVWRLLVDAVQPQALPLAGASDAAARAAGARPAGAGQLGRIGTVRRG